MAVENPKTGLEHLKVFCNTPQYVQIGGKSLNLYIARLFTFAG
jgi:hypothetical protein